MPFGFRRQPTAPQAATGERFADVFSPDCQFECQPVPIDTLKASELFGTPVPRYSDFIARSTHPSYSNGLLRILLPGGTPDLARFNSPGGWTSTWSEFTGLRAFAYDWLGRLHVVDTRGEWSKAGTVVRFSPEAGDVEAATTSPVGLDEYLLDLLPRHKRDWLSADYFEDWLAAGGRPLAPTECAGYRIPLVLGGEDDVPNLGVSDLEVYLSMAGQIHRQIRDLPEGTPVTGVHL